MANNPFDRTIINLREKPLSGDINQAQAQLDRTTRALMYQLLAKRASSSSDALTPSAGFLPESMRVLPSGGNMNVVVKAGIGFVDDPTDTPTAIDSITSLDDLSSYKPLVLMSDTTFTVPAAPGVGQARIDIIEVKYRRDTTDPQSRLVLNPDTGAFDPTMVDKSLTFCLDGSAGYIISPANGVAAITYKRGVAAAAGSEVEPSVSPGYVQIARINVGASVSAITLGDIADRRKLLMPGGVAPFAASFRLQYNAGAGLVTPRNIIAPPSVRICLRPEPGSHGVGALYIVGGEFQYAVCNISVHRGGGADFGASAFVHSYFNPAAPQDGLTLANGGGEKAIIEAAIVQPPTPIAYGARYAKFPFASRHQSSGTTSSTDAALDDLYVHFNGLIYY